MKQLFYIASFFFAVSIISCKSNKDMSDTELNMDGTEEPAKRPDGSLSKLDMLIAEIGIEGKKAERFKTIYNKYQEKRMDIKKKGGKPQQMMKEAFALRDKQNAEVEDILSDDEYEKYLIAINDKAGRPVLKKEEQPVK